MSRYVKAASCGVAGAPTTTHFVVFDAEHCLHDDLV